MRFEAQERDGVIKVRARKSLLGEGRRQKHLYEMTESLNKVVVVGGGAAGFSVLQTLRQEGFTGQITLISSESYLPYDRPRLSKVYGVEHKDIKLRDKSWYDTSDIKVMLEKEVESIAKNHVLTMQGDIIAYTHLVLALGSCPKKLGVPGEELQGVTGLRSLEQAQAIYSKIKGKGAHVVIIGSSFIGMEIAGTLVDKVERVTVVGRDSFPFRKTLGEKVGKIVMKIRKKGFSSECWMRFWNLRKVKDMQRWLS